MLISLTGEISEPRNVRLLSSDSNSLTFSWERPTCGTPNRYEFVNEGYDEHVRTDVQTGHADAMSTTVTGLMPGTNYMFRVRALAPGQQPGPWTDTVMRGATIGNRKLFSFIFFSPTFPYKWVRPLGIQKQGEFFLMSPLDRFGRNSDVSGEWKKSSGAVKNVVKKLVKITKTG